CCLAFLCTCVEATEELEMAWMKKVSLQGATVAAVVGDASGCTFVTGDTSEDFGPGYPNLGRIDVYLSKYNAEGDLMWIYPLGTEEPDSARCLTLDAEGNCFVGGQTSGSLAPNLIEDIADTQPDAFVAKISSEGNCVWIRQFGGAQSDSARRLRLDHSGNCYVAGNTTCSKLMEVGGGGRSGDSGTRLEEYESECPFVAKFDSTGGLLWFSQVAESYAETGLGVGVDPNGTVVLAGQPGYVATFDANGSLLESCPLEHRFEKLMNACSDDLGHVYLVGRESGWVSTIIQYDLKGLEVWSARFQENGWSNTKSMVVCPDGSHDLVTVGCQGGPSGGGSCQTFLRRYSQSGNLVSLFGSPEGYCGARAGADSLQGGYAISSLQGTGDSTNIFRVQSALTIAASQYLQAENANFQGASIETTQPDYSGQGYIHLSGDDCSVEWETDVTKAGIRTAYMRYMNLNAESVFAVPRLNDEGAGRRIITIELPPTGDQHAWSVVPYDLNLRSGANTFTIIPEADTIQQGLYMDSLEIVKPGGNIAFGKAFVCSDETQDDPADAALDGKLNTAWQVRTYPQWVEIDLGHAYPIDQTALFCEGAGPCQFIIEARATIDDPYQLLVDNSTNTTSASLMKPLQDTFEITDVRYVRLTVTGDAMHSASIHEICLGMR
ncbi:MAG: discoidin domain-containing protein, partial [Planctomycetota bacterium]